MNTNKKVKLTANILFSGIGCQERGFENSGLFDVEVLNTSDINKEAVLSYAAIHCGLTNEMVETYENYPSRDEMAQYLTDINLGYEPEKDKYFDWFKLAKRKTNDIEKYWLACKLTKNLGDISRIEELPYADFWTCSFPCTDISVAGKMKGLSPDSGTRSSLLWENIKLLKKAKDNNALPKYIMFENVKNLVSKNFIEYFNNLVEVLDELGFNSYWSVINGKDCGVPQNRERVFVVSIRKDIDTKKYTFPVPFDTGIRLKDILEDTVDEKYYLSEEVQNRLKITDESFSKNIVGTTKPEYRTIGQRDLVYQQDSIMGALVATDYKQPKQILENAELKQVGQMYGTEREPNPQAGRVYNSEGLSPTLDTCSGGNRMPKILEEQRYIDNINEEQSFVKRKAQAILDENGELPEMFNPYNKSEVDGIAPTQTTQCGSCTSSATVLMKQSNYRVRKLTPRECFRLMGLTFTDCDNAIAIGVADSQLYKQAGNGIISDCCELLAEHLYKSQYDETYACRDEIINKDPNNETNSILVRGNYMPSNHDASRIVDEDGIAPCVKENHGTVTGVLQRNFTTPQSE